MKRYILLHLGIGNVGKALVRLIRRRQDLVYAGLFTSRGGLFQPKGLSQRACSSFSGTGSARVTETLRHIDHRYIIIDTTNSDQTSAFLEEALRRGARVAIANKKPLTQTQRQWHALVAMHKGTLRYETTVGAGLPVIGTLRTFLSCGDAIQEISCCTSGTLGFLFSSMEEGALFSEALSQAMKQQLTEPDPRDDLSGLDVARKALILFRTIGGQGELRDISVVPLYPPELSRVSQDAFIKNVRSMDKWFEARMCRLKKAGKTLRYTATITPQKLRVGLQEVPCDSDVGSLKGPDNIFVFKTQTYANHPFIIKGPGAGVEVTALGVYADILSLC